MNYLGKFVTGFKYFYDEINPSNLTGAIDVVVVEDEGVDGSGQAVATFRSSPFHVKFGKYDILQPKERRVDLTINGRPVDVKMKLGSAGEAYFPRPGEFCDCKSCSHQAATIKLKAATIDTIDRVDGDDSLSNNEVALGVLSDSEVYDYVHDKKKRTMSESQVVDDKPARRLKSVSEWEWGELPKTVTDRSIQNASRQAMRAEDEDSFSFTSDNEVANISDRLSSFALDASPSNSPVLSAKRQQQSPDQSPVSTTSRASKQLIFDRLSASPTSESDAAFSCRVSLCGELSSSTKKPAKFEALLLTFETLSSQPTILYDKDVVVEINGKYYNWMVAAPLIVSSCIFKKNLSKESIKDLKSQYKKNKKRRGWFMWRNSVTEPNDKATSDDDNDKDGQTLDEKTKGDANPKKNQPTSNNRCKRRVLKLESENIAKLGLVDGANDISFTVTSKFQGTVTINSRIFLWKKLDKIVISDIDGTITKSDVLGHVMYFAGKEWVHQGVTKVLNQIRLNGYRIVYLSSRTIGIANITRNFIQTVNTGEIHLPEGPILLSPSSLFQAIHAEIIENKPEIFKIGCLNDIKSLFPPSVNPFYSGFGNRMNDALAYKTMGINDSHIFIINKQGLIKNEHSQYQSITFESLATYVSHIFPDVGEKRPATQLDQTPQLHNFSDLMFWKNQYLPVIESSAASASTTNPISPVNNPSQSNKNQSSP